MCRSNLRDYGKAETNAAITPGLETAEDVTAFVVRHTGTTIANAQTERVINDHFDIAPLGSMRDCVVNQIFQRQHDSRVIARDQPNRVRADQGKLDVACDR